MRNLVGKKLEVLEGSGSMFSGAHLRKTGGVSGRCHYLRSVEYSG